MASRLTNDWQAEIELATGIIEPHLIEIRRDLHAHPELGFEEVRTAAVVAAELKRLGIDCQTGIGRTGVVGTIRGGHPGPTLAIRADMDALPIHEDTGLAFASTVPGKMHACGHDIHTSTLLGIAAVLKDMAPRLHGNVKLLFQPAEEILGGAAAMIADGVLDGVDMAFGFHNQPDAPVGTFGYVPGAELAATDRFEIVVRGKSGHAAFPDGAVDPIIASASLILQLQTIVSREINPMLPAVVTVASIHGGSVHNIISGECRMLGTVRTLSPQARTDIEKIVRRMCAGMLETMRVSCEVIYDHGTPPLINDDAMLARSIASVRQQFGDASVQQHAPTLAGEDFSLISDKVPSFHLRIGSGAPGRNDFLHNSAYQPDEKCIGNGVQAITRMTLDLLS